MIDLTKKYRTASGKRVINLKRVPYNSAGRKVTFSIKGSIILREKPLRVGYQIWTDEGICDPVHNAMSSLNLVEVSE